MKKMKCANKHVITYLGSDSVLLNLPGNRQGCIANTAQYCSIEMIGKMRLFQLTCKQSN